MKPLLGVVAVMLVGCSEPPRSAAYFEAHPDQTAKVLLACAGGSQRGPECEAARDGRAAIERKARMELYRKGFE